MDGLEGILGISKCSFWKNSINGVSSLSGLFNNDCGCVFICNSNFVNNDYSSTIHNFNYWDVFISNCSEAIQKFAFAHPEVKKESKIKHRGFIDFPVLSFAFGVVSGGVGLAGTGSMVVGGVGFKRI